MEEENLSSVSFVSSISASSSVHQPRPPDGPKPTSQRFHTKRSGKVVRSPYLATSTPYPSNKKHKTSDDNEHTIYNPESQSPIKDKWAKHIHSVGRGSYSIPHPSASLFLQSLMKTSGFSAAVTGRNTNKRKRTHSAASIQSTRNQKSKPNPVTTGGPGALTSDTGQLDAIALRDETVRLKQLLNAVMKERDLAKAQQVKLQQEAGRKDKQIHDLLASGHISSQDATRSLAGTGKSVPTSQGAPTPSSSNSAISFLRQKVHSLEQALREKERELVSFRSEVSVTKVKEMEIQTEAYYREICRLTQMFSERDRHHSSLSEREAQIKLKALNQATVKMATQIEKMEQKNIKLMKKLVIFEADKSVGSETITHNEQGLRGTIADRYVDHKRSQLLSAVVDLELRVREGDASIKSLCSEMETKKSHYERRIGELTGAQSDSRNQTQSLQVKLSEIVSSRDKLRNVVRKLKDDRTHYRTVAENTQESLAAVQEHLESEKLNKSGVIKELEVLREKHQNEMTAREHARRLADRKSHVFTPERERQQAAAATIQHHWKHRQATHKQKKFEDERNQAALDIQSALRGHMARRQMVSSASQSRTERTGDSDIDTLLSDSGGDDSDSSNAVETIQSAIRGYLAREMAMKDLQRPMSIDLSQSEHDSPLHQPNAPPVNDLWRTSHDKHERKRTTSALVGYHPPKNFHGTQEKRSLEEKSPESLLYKYDTKQRNKTMKESRNLQLKEESSCDRIDLHASFLESSSCTDSDVTPVNTVNNSFLLDELQ